MVHRSRDGVASTQAYAQGDYIVQSV